MKFTRIAATIGSCVVTAAGVSPWYEQLTMFHFPHFAAMDMNGDNVIPSVEISTADYVLVEFYAPWCPHCQHFGPDYERLAFTINRFNNATHRSRLPWTDPTILAATVDCVEFEEACNAWNIQDYPTMLWGTRGDWLANARDRLTLVEVNHTAEAVAEWINEQTHLHLDPSLVSRHDMLKLLHASSFNQTLAPGQQGAGLPQAHKADVWDIQLGAGLLLHSAMRQLLVEAQMSGELSVKRHRALLDFVDVLQRRFPEAGEQTVCSSSLAALSTQLHRVAQDSSVSAPRGLQNTTLELLSPNLLESKWTLCGTPWKTYGSRGWRACKGTYPGKRGFTCGLWTMLHALASRTEDSSAGRDLAAMRGALTNFFECEECREHFETLPVHPEDTVSRRAVQLWWWKTHNAVNTRVKGLEEKFDDGDPAYPKVQWPTAAECPACRLQPTAGPRSSFLTTRKAFDVLDWNLDEVAAFLDRYYGK